MAIDAIIVHDMKINEYSVHFSVYFQRVTPSEKVEIERFRFHFLCHAERSEMTFQQSGERSQKTKRNCSNLMTKIKYRF